MTVSSVWKWANGMVMVFDDRGEQVPELQGQFSRELFDKIRDQADDATEWRGFEAPIHWPSDDPQRHD